MSPQRKVAASPCKHQQPCRADRRDDPPRGSKQRDLGDDADGPERADYPVRNALRPPMQTAEAVIEGVTGLDHACREQKQQEERRAHEIESVGELEAAKSGGGERRTTPKLTRQEMGAKDHQRRSRQEQRRTVSAPSVPMRRPEPRLATMKLSEPHSLTLP